MATVTIPSIHFGNPASTNQELTFEYKLWSASSWNLVASNVEVDTDGNIVDSPLPTITGLIEGNLYYIRAYNECSSPIEYFTISVQL